MRHALCSLVRRVMTDIFRRIVEEAREISIILLDLEGRIELWNRGAEAIFGYAEEEALGRHFELLVLPVDREHGAPQRELALALETGRADDTRWHLHKSGRLIFM